jgi:hypothetical protein
MLIKSSLRFIISPLLSLAKDPAGSSMRGPGRLEPFLAGGNLADFFSALRAVFAVDTRDASTLRARPPAAFGFEKFPDTVSPDVLQVFNHAHAITGPISFVQVFDPFTGIFCAGEAIPGAALSKGGAILDLAVDAGCVLPGVLAAAAGAFRFLTQIRQANPAVHPTGRDQYGFHG